MLYNLTETDIIPNEHTGQACFENSYILGHIMVKRTKKYVVHCPECAKDTELFPQPLFTTYQKYIDTNVAPCGCNPLYSFSHEQRQIILERLYPGGHVRRVSLEDLGVHTKYEVICKQGHSRTGSFTNIRRSQGCFKCAVHQRRQAAKVKVEADILEYLTKNSLPYKFKYVDEAFQNVNSEMVFECPTHGIKRQKISAFLSGHWCRDCSCRPRRYAYVLSIQDQGLPVALKFGITKNVHCRVKALNKRNLFKADIICVYEFENDHDSIAAETELKSILPILLSKREMKDGSSETTSIQYLDTIIKVYIKHGGKLINL
uniref:Endonuclease n=1 Tax=Klebsiella phage FKP3 TaxID=3231233 RepID=A0AAU8HZY3_9CAUD